MAVAVLDRFQQDSKYRSCPPRQKKVAVVEGGTGEGAFWRGGGWWRFDCTSIKFVTKRFLKNSNELKLMKFLVKSQIVIS